MSGILRNPLSLGWRYLQVGLLLLGLALIESTSFGSTVIKLNGITGGSTQPGYAGWIDVSEMHHGFGRAVTIGGGGGSSGLPSHANLTFTKPVDKSSPALDLAVCQGNKINDAQIEFIQASSPYLQFYKIKLTDVFVAEVSTSGSSGGAEEDVALFYTKIDWTYTQVGVSGQPAQTTSWNLISNTGTNTTILADSDADGMPDSYETANGLNPNVNDASTDSDGDGLTNYQEFLAGTKPNDFTSVFRVSRITLASGQVRVTWTSETGRTYTVRASSNVNGPYIPVRNVPSAGATETYTDFAASAAMQFYRVTTP